PSVTPSITRAHGAMDPSGRRPHPMQEHHMNPQSEDLARAVTDARLAAARQRELARMAKDIRRATRPVGRATVPAGWWRRWSGRRIVAPTPSTAAGPEHAPAGIEGLLDRTAQRVVANGTRSEAPVLRAMSVA